MAFPVGSRSTGELITAAIWNADLKDNLNILKTVIDDTGDLRFVDATELTIASDAITVTQNYHRVDTEADAAADNLATITAGASVAAGFVLVLRAENVARVVTVKDGTGNILLGGDCVLSATDRTLTLIYDGTNWRELSRSVNAGTIAIASQAAQDFIFASSASQFARLAAVDGKVPKYTTAGGWAMAAGSPMELLRAASGTDTNTAATVLDSIALSGLTILDSLLVVVNLSQITQQTTGDLFLRNTTDSVNLAQLSENGNMLAGYYAMERWVIRQDQSSNLQIMALGDTWSNNAGAGQEVAQVMGRRSVATTPYTDPWTLGLYSGGQTAGGTTRWNWAVYAYRGQ